MNSIFYSVPQFRFENKMHCGPKTSQEWLKPKWNVEEFDGAYHLEIALPGFHKQEVNMKFENDMLSIKAEKELSNSDVKFIFKEFANRKRKLNLKFENEIIADKIEAKFEQGILFITLPKKQITPTHIEVK